MPKEKKKEKERVEIIIDEILSGGFTEDELDQIIEVCGEELEKIENEE